jgi:cell shape-determining protein MreD
MKALSRIRMSSRSRQFLNFGVTFVSVMLCILILPTRLPGMELLGIGPNWLLIWLVCLEY